jgi:hypothetical protein
MGNGWERTAILLFMLLSITPKYSVLACVLDPVLCVGVCSVEMSAEEAGFETLSSMSSPQEQHDSRYYSLHAPRQHC